jgi:hypothetical protein
MDLGLRRAAVIAVAGLAMLSAPAGAAPNSSCALFNKSLIKKTFGLKYFDAVPDSSVVRDGATEEVCDAIVTSINPSTKSARHYIKTHGLSLTAQGKEVTLHVSTWESVDDPSDPFDPDTVLTGFEKAGHGFYITHLKGTSFAVPNYGANAAVGYQGPIHGRRQASAMWRASGRVIELTLLEKRSLPIEKLLKKVAANTAAAFI